MSDDNANQDNETTREENSATAEISNRKRLYNLFGTILLALLFVVVLVWVRFTPGLPEEDDSPPEQQETQVVEIQPAKQDKAADLRDSNINDALNNFLELNYKGWQQQGKSFDDDASDEDRLQIFDVHLINSNKNQVIRVFVEKFQKDTNSEYWFAYQPDDRLLLESAVKTAVKKSSDDDSSEKSDSGNSKF